LLTGSACSVTATLFKFIAGAATVFLTSGAGAEGAAVASTIAPVDNIAIGFPTGITSPSLQSFLTNTPSDGAGISESTLSVAISTIVSSAFTLSPSFLTHLIIVASVTLSPILGINISICDMSTYI